MLISRAYRSNDVAKMDENFFPDWLRYRHITYRTESENIDILYM